MFRNEGRDDINNILLQVNKSKVLGLQNSFNRALTNKYVFKNVAVNEYDDMVPKTVNPHSNLYDICYTNKFKMPYCKFIKPEFNKLD